MTDKDLLIQDFCGRLPYRLKTQVLCWDENEGEINVPLTVYSVNRDGYVYFESNDYNVEYSSIEECMPYLRPMASMTEEEEKEYNLLANRCMCTTVGFIHLEAEPLLDWLNKKMFDFRGLIPKDLALSTEVFNPYTN